MGPEQAGGALKLQFVLTVAWEHGGSLVCPGRGGVEDSQAQLPPALPVFSHWALVSWAVRKSLAGHGWSQSHHLQGLPTTNSEEHGTHYIPLPFGSLLDNFLQLDTLHFQYQSRSGRQVEYSLKDNYNKLAVILLFRFEIALTGISP